MNLSQGTGESWTPWRHIQWENPLVGTSCIHKRESGNWGTSFWHWIWGVDSVPLWQALLQFWQVLAIGSSCLCDGDCTHTSKLWDCWVCQPGIKVVWISPGPEFQSSKGTGGPLPDFQEGLGRHTVHDILRKYKAARISNRWGCQSRGPHPEAI